MISRRQYMKISMGTMASPVLFPLVLAIVLLKKETT